MDNESPDVTPTGIDRRSLLKRSAVVGGALVWTTPIVQTIAAPAFAQASPVIVGCPPGETVRTAAKFEFDCDDAFPCLGEREDVGGDNLGTCFESVDVSVGVTETPGDGIISVTETSATSLTVVLAEGFILIEAGVKIGNDENAPCAEGTVAAETLPNTYTVTIASGDISNVLLVIDQVCPPA